MHFNKKDIIDRIDYLIRESGLTANEFAQKIGKRPGIVTDWRTGRSFPGLDVLFDICIALNCKFYDIIPICDECSHKKDRSNQVELNRVCGENELIFYYQGMSLDDREELLMIAEMKYTKETKRLEAKERARLSHSKGELLA